MENPVAGEKTSLFAVEMVITGQVAKKKPTKRRCVAGSSERATKEMAERKGSPAI